MTDCTPRYVADFEKGDIVLVYDRWDVWEFDPSGVKPPVVLTDSAGRRANIQLRLIALDRDADERAIDEHLRIGNVAFDVQRHQSWIRGSRRCRLRISFRLGFWRRGAAFGLRRRCRLWLGCRFRRRGRRWGRGWLRRLRLRRHDGIRAFAVGQPHIIDRMFDTMQARACCKHPT